VRFGRDAHQSPSADQIGGPKDREGGNLECGGENCRARIAGALSISVTAGEVANKKKTGGTKTNPTKKRKKKPNRQPKNNPNKNTQTTNNTHKPPKQKTQKKKKPTPTTTKRQTPHPHIFEIS